MHHDLRTLQSAVIPPARTMDMVFPIPKDVSFPDFGFIIKPVG
jgi:hypothetical protein